MHKVFVYGTLKRGQHNNALLEGATFIGAAITQNKHRLFDCGFPVLRPRSHNTTIAWNAVVHGEVYEVDDETLKDLDRLESEGRMYHRKEIRVHLQRKSVKVFAYIGDAKWVRDRGLRLYAKPDGSYNWPCKRQDLQAAE